jgi:hypothetical protein
MNRWIKRLEVAVNVAILSAFIMVAALAAQWFWYVRATSGASDPKVGTKLSLVGVDWSKSDRNLVLALSSTCHFCTESAEFYKMLVPEAAGHGIPVIAVLPQAPAEARSYLDGLGVSVQNVFQSSLDSVNASATPTLFIVDRKGKIKKAWVGKLGSERASQVIASLQ